MFAKVSEENVASVFRVEEEAEQVTIKLLGLLKSTIFWDTTPCNQLKINRRFGGIYGLHLQGQKQQNRTLFSTCFQAGFLLGLFFNPEYGGNMYLRNVG
jgi:hypothetical protein